MCSSYYSFIKSGVVTALCLALWLKHSAHITSRILCTLLRVMLKSLCISARKTICSFAIICNLLLLFSFFQVSGWKYQDPHQEPSYELKRRWNLHREQQDAQWDEYTHKMNCIQRRVLKMSFQCMRVCFCPPQALMDWCMEMWMVWTWRWVIRYTGTWWQWATMWTYTPCTGMDTVWNIRYINKKQTCKTVTHYINILQYAQIPTHLSLQLGGGPHRTDSYELFPATFQVKPPRILTPLQQTSFVLSNIKGAALCK